MSGELDTEGFVKYWAIELADVYSPLSFKHAGGIGFVFIGKPFLMTTNPIPPAYSKKKGE